MNAEKILEVSFFRAITIDGKAQWLDEDVNKTELPYDCQQLLLAFLRQHVNKFNLLQLIYLFYYN